MTRRSTRRAARSRRAGSPGPGPFSEDCLYLNVVHADACVATPSGRCSCGSTAAASRQDASRNYDGSKLAASGIVVVTINYRLGALGFLAHPALASQARRPGRQLRADGPAGRAALGAAQHRAVRRRPAQRDDRGPVGRRRRGARPPRLARLARAVPTGDRAERRVRARRSSPLADAEAAGEAFAATARAARTRPRTCLRNLPVDDLVDNFPGAAIPGVVDGKVLTESIGTALAAGRFARVPILNGINHDEELLFVAGLGVAVSGGTFVPVPTAGHRRELPERDRSGARRAGRAGPRRIAAEYPLGAYPDRRSWRSARWSRMRTSRARRCRSTAGHPSACRPSPTSSTTTRAPQRFAPPGALPPIATHSSELQYLFDQPNTPVPATLERRSGDRSPRRCAPLGRTSRRPATRRRQQFLGPRSTSARRCCRSRRRSPVEYDFASTHHCAFWGAG